MGSNMMLLGLLIMTVVWQHGCRILQFWVAQHGLVNPTDLTSPFAAERVIDHAPLGQWAQVLHATYLHSM